MNRRIVVMLSLAAAGIAEGGAIRISDFMVDRTRVVSGQSFTVSIMATGAANYCIRHDRAPGVAPLPGWTPHGKQYAFVSSTDFTGPGPYKNAHICHKDNGQRDTDLRRDVFSITIDTSNWPDGEYAFAAMATNRPEVGNFRGELREFRIQVGGAPTPGPEQDVSRHVCIDVNGRAGMGSPPVYSIYPGCANRMTVGLPQNQSLTRACDLVLVCTRPDGRTSVQRARLAGQDSPVTFDLGVFLVPARFDFEHGVVYREGTSFRLSIVDAQTKRQLECLTFSQTIGSASSGDVLRLGDGGRQPHHGWPGSGDCRPGDPPVLLWLAQDVLADHAQVRAHYQLRNRERRLQRERDLVRVKGCLRVSAQDGEVLFEHAVQAGPKRQTQSFDAAGWPEGRYSVELVPDVEKSEDRHGPVVEYRRMAPTPGQVRVSPFAPWTFDRDTTREELMVADLREAVRTWATAPPDPAHWGFRPWKDGVSLIATNDDWRKSPVVLRLPVRGTYAVFAATENGFCYIRVERDGIPRGLRCPFSFVTAADLTDGEIAIYAPAVKNAGLRSLRLVPVTASSVAAVHELTSNPPTPLLGVADWCDYFVEPSVWHSAGTRLAEDQFDALLKGHAELGLRTIAWSIGRSWVEYHSKLPATTRFPCAPLEQIPEQYQRRYAGRAHMINAHRPLEYVLKQRPKYGLKIFPWLAMQRHYGTKAYGGIFASEWFREHPQWHRWSKGAAAATGAVVSYYFPEVRKERVDIFCEVARKSPDGIVVGCCRQVPMLLYHPEMVAAYQRKTGVNSLQIDAGDQQEYDRWIRWRAEFFTKTLRELKERLDPIRAQTERPIPVSIRVPSKGLFYNMAQGLDVESWCREKLVARLQLDPLEDCDGRGSPHDVRPYLELGRRHGIEVYGGIGLTVWNYAVIMKRALGLLEAGVDGIEFYESNNYAIIQPQRWIIPLLGNQALLREFLGTSNLDACFPVWARNAASGFDNHSFHGKWDVHGFGANSL